MAQERGKGFGVYLLRDFDRGVIRVLNLSEESFISIESQVLKESSWERKIHKEDISSYKQAVADFLNGRDNVSLTYRFQSPDGKSYIEVKEELVRISVEGKVFAFSILTKTCDAEIMGTTLECQRIMNGILEVAFQDKPLKEVIQDILDRLLQAPWLPEGGAGVIFLFDKKSNRLKMAAHRNMPPYIIQTCGSLELGKCICGKAAQRGSLVFVNHVNHEHEIRFEGMADHGHYALPIIFERELVGVLSLYLKPGHPYSQYEVSFLEAVCKTIASIIKHKVYEEKLENLSIAIEQTPDWVVIADRSGRIEYVNRAVEKITGFSREEIVGNTPRIWKSGRHNIKFFENLWKSILSGKPYRSIFINRRKDGEIFYLDQTITPVRDKDGNIVKFISTGKDITESKIYEDRIYRLAYYDTLTGLPNRNLFMERLSEILKSRHKPFGIAIMDLDRLKFLNETYSPYVGDEVLKEIASRISSILDSDSLAARLGSDEFALLIAQDTEEAITLFLEELLQEISRPIKLGEEDVVITASIGVSKYPEDGEEASTLMKNAELALIQAKELGRNNYQFYAPDMNTKAVEFMLLSKHLLKAADRDEFVIYLQPYVDTKTKEIVGAEVLLRWNSEDLGLVSPAKFIPILEDTKLINRVGDGVMRKSGELLKKLKDGLELSVNVSPVQLMSKDFYDRITSICRELRIDPGRITLEITENVFVRDEKEALKLLLKLKSFGFKLAIDDFGTGYSSLNYLRLFPLDRVKIDISYVRDMPYDDKDEAIVKTIIDMSHALDMETIAEGVETEVQMDILRELGCDMQQGYLFYQPMPVEDFIDLIS